MFPNLKIHNHNTSLPFVLGMKGEKLKGATSANAQIKPTSCISMSNWHLSGYVLILAKRIFLCPRLFCSLHLQLFREAKANSKSICTYIGIKWQKAVAHQLALSISICNFHLPFIWFEARKNNNNEFESEKNSSPDKKKKLAAHRFVAKPFQRGVEWN